MITTPLKAGGYVAVFSFVVVGLVTLLFDATKEKRAANEYQAVLVSLQQVLAGQEYDNDVVHDVIDFKDYKVYRARRSNTLVALVMQVVAQGYAGDIELLIALTVSGELVGVDVVKHRETPGLGDKIERRKSNWLASFKGMRVTDMRLPSWAVKRDGGQFEQFTGATITPRAVVQRIKAAGLFMHTQVDTWK